MKLLRSRAFFTCVLLLGVLVMLALTPRLGSIARFVPLVVLLPTAALLAVQLGRDLAHREERARPAPEAHAAPAAAVPQEPPASGTAPRPPVSGTPAALLTRPLARFVWALSLPGVIYLLGFPAAVPLHAFLYLRVLSRERWSISLLVPAGLLCVLLFLTRLVPGAALWPGWTWMHWGLVR